MRVSKMDPGWRRNWQERGDTFTCPLCGLTYVDKPGKNCSMGYGPEGIRIDLDAGISILDKPAHPFCVLCTRKQEK